MTKDTKDFIAALTKTYIDSGLPHSMAKVLVHLTICEPSKETAPEIQKQLGLSAGSVNTALNLLLRAGLISRSKTAGDKRYFYELESDAWLRAMMQRVNSIDQYVDLAKQGTTLMPNNPRLQAMQDIYEYFGEEFRGIMERYEQRK